MLQTNYLADALAFSSGRRLVFLELYSDLARELGLKPPSEEAVLPALESIHCAATIVDDMLDNEGMRRGRPTFYVRHTQPVAAFASLNLMIRGIELLMNETLDQGIVLEHIRAMIDAEEADVGLRKRSANSSPLQWYEKTVSRKIAAELSLMAHMCLTGPIDERVREAISLASNRVGQFIQYCDDRLDVLIRDPFALQDLNDGCVLTYSLPLAVFMTTHDRKFENHIGAKINEAYANRILRRVRSKENVFRVDAFIERKHKQLTSSLRALNLKTPLRFVEICEAARTSAYWEDIHAVA